MEAANAHERDATRSDYNLGLENNIELFHRRHDTLVNRAPQNSRRDF